MRMPSLSHVFALVSSALVFVPPASLGNVHMTTITRPGTGFDAISGYYPDSPGTGDPADEGQDGCTWYRDGTAIFTPWDHGGAANHLGHCLWVLYMAELTPGYWRLGLNARNHGRSKGRRWYPGFDVLVELEGPLSPLSLSQRAIVRVPASDEEVRSGHQFFLITRPGMYGIKYTWLNDKFECTDPDWKPGDECGAAFEWYDVNIMIDSVFFDGTLRRSRGASGAPVSTTR